MNNIFTSRAHTAHKRPRSTASLTARLDSAHGRATGTGVVMSSMSASTTPPKRPTYRRQFAIAKILFRKAFARNRGSIA